MTSNQDNQVNENQAYQPEKFSEPRTMPKGWDLSGLVEHVNSKRNNNQHGNPTHPDMSDGSDDMGWVDNKFSEPRTTPKNWDVSALK